MGGVFSRMNPFLRGMLVLALIAAVVVVLQLEATLTVVSALLSIVFVLAIAFFVYLVWRENRAEIATWSVRARTAFYGAALLIVVDLGVRWAYGSPGYQLLAFLAVIAICGVAMWRVWRDQRTYS
jgi:preprotein translocase subunit YajC